MRVLYVSKASHTPAHRDKLRVLGERVRLHTIVPAEWGGQPLERTAPDQAALEALPVLFSGQNHLHLYRGLHAAAVAARPDLIHLDEEPYSLVTGQGAAIARKLRIPYLFFAWQNVPKRYPFPFGRVRSSVLRTAAGGIAGSDEAEGVLRAFGYEGPVAVIPQMGVDTQRFRPDPERRAELRGRRGWTCEDVVVGYLGRLVPEKGLDTLIEAGEGASFRLVVGGEGPQRAELEALADRLDVRVAFDGPVPSLEVHRWLRALDVLVLPSRTTARWKEQFGRVLIEAMASEVPVVATRSGEIPNVVGDAGLLVPEGDAHALAAALGALTADAELRRRLGRRGRERVESRFTQAHVVDATVDFYETLLGAAGS